MRPDALAERREIVQGVDVVREIRPKDDRGRNAELGRVGAKLLGASGPVQRREEGRARQTKCIRRSVARGGDRDLGLHLVRTQALRAGEPLSAVTKRFVAALGVGATMLPATDDPLRTWVETPAGDFPFQDWYVGRGHRDEVTGVRYEGDAKAAPGVLEALAGADLIAIAPSNPYLSIGPILAVEEIRAALEQRRVPAVAVSPLIGGRTVKGPADRMLERFAGGTEPKQVADCYKGLIDALVIDEADDPGELDVTPIVTRTLMTDAAARRRLAEAVLDVALVRR